jgi:hypothetical protein
VGERGKEAVHRVFAVAAVVLWLLVAASGRASTPVGVSLRASDVPGFKAISPLVETFQVADDDGPDQAFIQCAGGRPLLDQFDTGPAATVSVVYGKGRDPFGTPVFTAASAVFTDGSAADAKAAYATLASAKFQRCWASRQDRLNAQQGLSVPAKPSTVSPFEMPNVGQAHTGFVIHQAFAVFGKHVTDQFGVSVIRTGSIVVMVLTGAYDSTFPYRLRSSILRRIARRLGSGGPSPNLGRLRTPSVKLIQWIADFNPASCVGNRSFNLPTLHGPTGVASATAACGALWFSQNDTPASSMSSRSTWTSFVASDNYRSFVAIPSVSARCTGGVLTGVRVDGHEQHSLGYTKVMIPPTPATPGITVYDKADRYYPRRNHGRGSFLDERLVVSRGQHSVVISYGQASRIANGTLGRSASYALLRYDAPFIWSDITETISCASGWTIRVARSNFPTAGVYENNRLIHTSAQTSDIAAFVEHGGRKFHRDGAGNPVSKLRLDHDPAHVDRPRFLDFDRQVYLSRAGVFDGGPTNLVVRMRAH